MTLGSLRDFISAARRSDRVVQIDASVDPDLEIAEIHRRVIAAGGPLLHFTNVKGSPYSVATNLFGTARRINLAFGDRPKQFVRDAVRAAHELMPPTPSALWSFRKFGLEGLRVGTTRRGSGPILEAMESPANLSEIPAITSWPDDGGPFVTLPLVYTEHPGPDGQGHNLGMYRMHVYDAQTTGMHWQIQKGGGFHHSAAEKQGRALPVTVFLGGPPALVLAADCTAARERA